MPATTTHNHRPLPTLCQIRRAYYISARDLADAAEIPLQTEYMMETGEMVSAEDAIKVLHALSLMTGHCHTLEQIGGLSFRIQEQRDELNPELWRE